ncbi:MAG: sulfite exporter TauE/SafE family protein [Nitrososphaerota archaeon]|nr:sulfite exporter TauE/SafE family protein [Nitrososphaerota archaeon]
MLFAFVVLILMVMGVLSMLVSTISGGGTNVVLIPALILAFQFSPGEAVGTSFLALTAGSTVAAIRFFRKGYVDLKRGSVLGASTVPGIVAGSLLSSLAEGGAFKVLLGLVVVGLAIVIAMRDRFDSDGARVMASSTKGASARTLGYSVDMKLGVILFAFLGVFVGFFGQGGGLLLVPIMQFLGFPIVAILGTARIIALFVGSAALTTRLAASQVNLVYGMALAAGTMIGGFLGTEVSTTMKVGTLRIFVALFIGLLGGLLVVESLL